MRRVDDVADGHLPVPQGFASASDFVKYNIEFDYKNPQDDTDYLAIYYSQLAKKQGFDLVNESKDILYSMLFDAIRDGKNIVYSQKTLTDHFDLLDIRGTICAALKIFGEDPARYEDLSALGQAARIYYTLRDFPEDVKDKQINISREDMNKYRLSVNDLRNPSAMRPWRLHEAGRGTLLLEKHRQNIKQTPPFKFVTRATLPFVYSVPARCHFNKILMGF